MLRREDWKNITGKSPEKDHLLLVWRESEDRNLFFMIPCDRIPEEWAWQLLELKDLYLDLETEEGNDDDLTRLLGLVYCAVNTVPKLSSIEYKGKDWPISAITGMWGKYLVSSTQLDKERVGLVVCTGSTAPPELDES